MVKLENQKELNNPSHEFLKTMSEDFSFINFYKQEGCKAGIVVTPEQVVIMVSQELMNCTNNNDTLHVYHRSFFKSIQNKLGKSNGDITSLNISCLSTNYANFCLVDTSDQNKNTITPKMMEVVNKIMRIIWIHPKEIQYEDMRSRSKITIKESRRKSENLIGVPINSFITMLDREFYKIQHLQDRDSDKER